MLKIYCLNLWDRINQKATSSETYLTNLGYFIIVTFPVFYLMNKYVIGIHGYESLFLRLSIGLLGLILVTIKYFSNSFKKLMPLILYSTLLYAFPFFFFFMLFNNPESTIWKVNVLSGLFFLSFFLSWKEYLAFSVLGFLLAWLAFRLTSIDGELPPDIIALAITYMNPVIYIALFSNKKDHINQEKLLAMKSLAGTIAHEMRTPFLGIRASVGGIQKFLLPLIDGYHKAKDAKLDVSPISEKNLHKLAQTPENLKKITLSASMVIDMLLITLKNDSFTDKNFETCSIRKCIAEMFHDYPLTSEQKSLISWKGNPDFSFYGNTLLMKHVLFNLLKNSLYYVKAANKGGVFLWTETTPNGNYLYFKDTGKGIPPSMVTHIFDRFYSHTQHGTGIGLAFCKSVMESFGGSILCESKEGEYTTFIMKFPILKQTDQISAE